jgi:hypothetical protein
MIQNIGDSFLNVVVILSYLLVVITGFSSMQFSVMAGLGYTIVGIVSVTMVFYVLDFLHNLKICMLPVRPQGCRRVIC